MKEKTERIQKKALDKAKKIKDQVIKPEKGEQQDKSEKVEFYEIKNHSNLDISQQYQDNILIIFPINEELADTEKAEK